MNRWIRRTVTFASLASTLALVPAGVALAQQTQASTQDKHHRGHREGLLGQALKLDSLTADQRSAIEQLAAQRRAANAPVRQADAQVLTVLAQQVEQASIDPQGLAPSLGAEQTAAVAQSAVERASIERLHAILTPAERNQLVDQIEASRSQAHPDKEHVGARGERGANLGLTADQKAKIRENLKAERTPDAGAPRKDQHKAALESFRSDTFDASAMVRVERKGERAEKLAKAMVPVLTPNQRTTLATELRNRAAHESHS